MQKILIGVAALLLSSTAAFANGSSVLSNDGCAGHGSCLQTGPTEYIQSQGQSLSQNATFTPTNTNNNDNSAKLTNANNNQSSANNNNDNRDTNTNTNVSSANNNANNDNRDTNTNTNVSAANNNASNDNHSAASAAGGAATGGAASATNSGNNSSNSNSTSYSSSYREAASSAWAPSLVSGNDVCMGSTSLGAQGVGFGISIGSTWHDENCESIKLSRELYAMGERPAALALLRHDKRVDDAMRSVGR